MKNDLELLWNAAFILGGFFFFFPPSLCLPFDPGEIKEFLFYCMCDTNMVK